jgi:hypothetical protein
MLAHESFTPSRRSSSPVCQRVCSAWPGISPGGRAPDRLRAEDAAGTYHVAREEVAALHACHSHTAAVQQPPPGTRDETWVRSGHRCKQRTPVSATRLPLPHARAARLLSAASLTKRDTPARTPPRSGHPASRRLCGCCAVPCDVQAFEAGLARSSCIASVHMLVRRFLLHDHEVLCAARAFRVTSRYSTTSQSQHTQFAFLHELAMRRHGAGRRTGRTAHPTRTVQGHSAKKNEASHSINLAR